MGYIYLLATLFCIISYYILSRQHIKFIESFYSSSDKNIILLGDSILKNNDYVTDQFSVENILRNKTECPVYCFAKNNEMISDVYEQLNRVSIDWNKDSTQIFLSVGGNDILNNYSPEDELFSQYINLVYSIKSKMNKSKIILLDIYYPNSDKYLSYWHIIKEWNNRLYNFVNNHSNKNIHLLHISNSVTEPDDFIYEIEPSKIGGEKIVDCILNLE